MNGRTAKDAYDNNAITLNQYREMIDQKPIDGGDVLKYEWERKN